MLIRGHFVIRYSHDELKIIHVLHRGSFIPPRDGPDALRCVVWRIWLGNEPEFAAACASPESLVVVENPET